MAVKVCAAELKSQPTGLPRSVVAQTILDEFWYTTLSVTQVEQGRSGHANLLLWLWCISPLLQERFLYFNTCSLVGHSDLTLAVFPKPLELLRVTRSGIRDHMTNSLQVKMVIFRERSGQFLTSNQHEKYLNQSWQQVRMVVMLLSREFCFINPQCSTKTARNCNWNLSTFLKIPLIFCKNCRLLSCDNISRRTRNCSDYFFHSGQHVSTSYYEL